MDARFSYRESAVRGASPVGLVICLYEQAIEDLRRAVLALEKRDVETRTRKINHALVVIGQLQGTLDMQRGGKVARDLNRFYDVIRAGLAQAQVKQSTKILQQQISDLAILYEAWLEVERAASAPAPQASQTPLAGPQVSPSERSLANWNA